MSEIKWKKISEIKISEWEDLKKFAHTLAGTIAQPSVVALSGPMAAGKTELVKLFGLEFGITEISSPTFALHQHYESKTLQIEHLDLYRIQSEDELDAAGFWDLFLDQSPRIIFIEWPEKMNLAHISASWPIYKVDFRVIGSSRSLTFFQS